MKTLFLSYKTTSEETVVNPNSNTGTYVISGYGSMPIGKQNVLSSILDFVKTLVRRA